MDANARQHDPSLSLGPVWTPLALMAGLVLVGGLLRPPEWLMACLVLAGFTALAGARPSAGLVFLLLAAAGFLGGPGRPWFWLLPAMVWLWIACASLRLMGLGGPGGGRLWLIPLVSLAAFPLGLHAMEARVWVTPLPVIWEQLLHPSVGYPLYPISELVNRLMGVALAATVWRWFSADGARAVLKALAPQMALLLITLCGVGWLLITWPELAGDHYLSLALVGHDAGGALTATTYNRQYLLIFITVAAPIAALPWLTRGGGQGLGRVLGAAALLAVAATAAATGQRSLVLASGGALLAALVLLKGRLLKRGLIAAGAGLALLIALDLATGATVLSRLAATGAGDYYLPIWQVALWQFGTHPVLGVGTGQYAAFAPMAAAALDTPALVKPEIFSTPHQQTLLLLAEGGVLILAAFAVSLVPVLARGAARARREYDPALFAALMGLAILLAFTLTQCVLYFRALGVMFWALVGLVGALARPVHQEGSPAPSPAGDMARPMWAVFAALLLFLGAAQFIHAVNAPDPELAAGFHSREKLGGRVGHWMGRRAVIEAYPDNGPWRACVASFVPGADKDPVVLTAMVDGRPAASITVDGPAWRDFTVPLNPGGRTLVRLQASRVYNPRAAGHSQDDRDLSVVLARPLGQGCDARP